ncbi:hypothetical protein [Dyella choica]|uniref:Uncharacterized protein n=1 Tax=Dyella choica TaxID=1927959 RepID=A0A3S0S7R1_9GAMM|nr:hypothetical protein [Dyella choica]RUL71436.1 hypothetical protein EKH80_18790 [Dyella choica]
MFGWLAARSSSLCRRAPRAVVSQHARRIAPHALIDMLPGLGSVLYLHAASDTAVPTVLPQGLVVTQRACIPLLDVHWLVAVSVVTDDGPREWCECVDLLGRTRARWYLLPDTDYLAWEALTSDCATHRPTPVGKHLLRPDQASVVNFRLRELAGMLLLEQDNSVMLSSLSHRLAARIAHAESAALSFQD